MVEYGNAVGQGSGGGGSGGGGGPIDVGGDITSFVSHAVDRIAALPPAALLVIAVVIILAGLFVLRRAF